MHIDSRGKFNRFLFNSHQPWCYHAKSPDVKTYSIAWSLWKGVGHFMYRMNLQIARRDIKIPMVFSIVDNCVLQLLHNNYDKKTLDHASFFLLSFFIAFEVLSVHIIFLWTKENGMLSGEKRMMAYIHNVEISVDHWTLKQGPIETVCNPFECFYRDELS